MLTNSEYEKIDFDLYPDLVRIRTDADGSCFFHALAKAFFKPYIVGKIDGEVFDRKEFIKNLRKDLAVKLGLKVDPKDESSKTYYATLAHGELKKISRDLPEYSLKKMQKELYSSSSISNIYNEFISDQLDLDIYILDAEKKDVYMTGTDDTLLYKNRRSVVILYLPGHYELVGLTNEEGEVETVFSPKSDFIQSIRSRMKELNKD
tara:strand:- start:2243 stop:2860 length:618 start_codon:yes stop_codon:yes gene_type:complete